jgi:hypothetical protein
MASPPAEAQAEFARLAAEVQPSPQDSTVTVERSAVSLSIARNVGAAGPGIVAWSSEQTVVAYDDATRKWIVTERWDCGSTESEANRGEQVAGSFDAPGPAIALARRRFGL